MGKKEGGKRGGGEKKTKKGKGRQSKERAPEIERNPPAKRNACGKALATPETLALRLRKKSGQAAPAGAGLSYPKYALLFEH